MNSPNLYSERQYQILKRAGEIHIEAQNKALSLLKVGVNLEIIDAQVNAIIEKNNATAAFYKYEAYPKHICISLNNEILHGIPNHKLIQKNDVVKVDIGVKYKGLIVDGAFTVIVTTKESVNSVLKSKSYDLVKTTFLSLRNSINQLNTNNYVGDICHIFASTINNKNYFLIQEYMGHGVGKTLHEEPKIPNSPKVKSFINWKLKNGMVIAIEPMLFNKKIKLSIKENGWTVCSNDKDAIGTHFEETIYIRNDKLLSLTKNKHFDLNKFVVY